MSQSSIDLTGDDNDHGEDRVIQMFSVNGDWLADFSNENEAAEFFGQPQIAEAIRQCLDGHILSGIVREVKWRWGKSKRNLNITQNLDYYGQEDVGAYAPVAAALSTSSSSSSSSSSVNNGHSIILTNGANNGNGQKAVTKERQFGYISEGDDDDVVIVPSAPVQQPTGSSSSSSSSSHAATKPANERAYGFPEDEEDDIVILQDAATKPVAMEKEYGFPDDEDDDIVILSCGNRDDYGYAEIVTSSSSSSLQMSSSSNSQHTGSSSSSDNKKMAQLPAPQPTSSSGMSIIDRLDEFLAVQEAGASPSSTFKSYAATDTSSSVGNEINQSNEVCKVSSSSSSSAPSSSSSSLAAPSSSSSAVMKATASVEPPPPPPLPPTKPSTTTSSYSSNNNELPPQPIVVKPPLLPPLLPSVKPSTASQYPSSAIPISTSVSSSSSSSSILGNEPTVQRKRKMPMPSANVVMKEIDPETIRKMQAESELALPRDKSTIVRKQPKKAIITNNSS